MARLDARAISTVLQALNWVYDRAIEGVPGLDSALDLAANYQAQFSSDEEAIEAMVRWQIAKAAAAGFLTNIGGALTLPVALPANLLSAIYIQIRMIAAIAALRGHDLRSDQVRTVILACLCGTSLVDIAKEIGIGIGAGLAQQAVASLSSRALQRMQHRGRFVLLRRTGTVELTRFAPVIGGLVGGALDGVLTRTYANAAKRLFLPALTIEVR